MKSWVWVAAAAALGLVLVGALGLAVVLSRQEPQLLPEDTPAGVVQRFLQAIEGREYQRAYDYLTARNVSGDLRSYDEFRRDTGFSRRTERGTVQVVLDGEQVEGDTAEVFVRMTRYNPNAPGLLGSPVAQQRDGFRLRREEGVWRILEYPYWVLGIY
jgi:hypothetical protein